MHYVVTQKLHGAQDLVADWCGRREVVHKNAASWIIMSTIVSDHGITPYFVNQNYLPSTPGGLHIVLKCTKFLNKVVKNR